MDRIDQAIEFGLNAHWGQVRKYTGRPYFTTHCVPVAMRVLANGGDEDMVIAALLHDTIEDTGVTYENIEDEFGRPVADLVLELSDEYTKEKYPSWNRAKRKEAEAKRLATISDKAKTIKKCDIEHNSRSIEKHDPDFASVYLLEKTAMLLAIED